MYEVVCSNCKLKCNNKKLDLINVTIDDVKIIKCKNFVADVVYDREYIRECASHGNLIRVEKYVAKIKRMST